MKYISGAILPPPSFRLGTGATDLLEIGREREHLRVDFKTQKPTGIGALRKILSKNESGLSLIF